MRARPAPGDPPGCYAGSAGASPSVDPGGRTISDAAQPWTRRSALTWAAILAAACAVYVTGIGHEPICYDEVISDALARRPLGELLGLLRFDNHPPLFYLLLHGVRAVLGSSEGSLRALSVAGSVGVVALGAGPVRRLVGDRTALLYAGVALSLPVLLIYAHEARMYTLAALAVTAAVAYGALAVRGGRRGDWIRFGVASLADPLVWPKLPYGAYGFTAQRYARAGGAEPARGARELQVQGR